jgi:hypothetical protein
MYLNKPVSFQIFNIHFSDLWRPSPLSSDILHKKLFPDSYLTGMASSQSKITLEPV